MRAYVFIKAHIGDIHPALGILRRTKGVISADAILGPYDIIALVEAEGLDELGALVTKQIPGIPEIIETTTCILLNQQ